MMEEKAKTIAEEAEVSDKHAEAELILMEAEKLRLREEIQDLKTFIKMQKRISTEAPEAQGQSFFTTNAPTKPQRKR